MAYEWGPRHAESYPAGVDLTNNGFFVGVLNASRQVVLAGAGQGSGIIEFSFKPTIGGTVALVDDGTTKVRLGGTVAVGDRLIAGSDGRAIKSTGGAGSGLAFGIAREAGVAGQIIAARVDFSNAQAY